MRKQIQRLLDSDLSSLHIAKQSGVEQSTVYRLRSGERQLGKLGLDNAEKLYKFANDIFVEEDTREQLLVNRASIMGMLNYMEMTDEEREKLNKEKLEIEKELKEMEQSYVVDLNKHDKDVNITTREGDMYFEYIIKPEYLKDIDYLTDLIKEENLNSIFDSEDVTENEPMTFDYTIKEVKTFLENAR